MFQILLIINALAFITSQLGRFTLQNGVAFTLLDITILLTVGIWIIGKIKRKEKITGSLSKGIFVFIGVCIVSLLANSWVYSFPQLGVASLYMIRFILYTSLYFVVKDQRAIKKELIKRWMLIGGIVILFLGYLQYFFYPDLRILYSLGWDEHLYRMFGTFLDPNYFGSFLVLLFLFVFQTKRKKIEEHDLRTIFFLLSTLIGVVLTYSRSAIIMGITAIVVYFLLIKSYVKMVGIIIFFMFCILLLSNYRIEGLNPFRIASTQARLYSMQNAVTIIKDHPVFGVGFNTYRYAQNNYGFRASPFWTTSHADAGTDNSFLFILATTGIVGLLAYIFLLKKILNLKKEIDKKDQAVFITIIMSLIIGSTFNNLLFYTPVMIWIWVYLGIMESS